MTAPLQLVEQVRAGNCVAFVGAGFSAAAAPGWIKLLELHAATPGIDPAERARVERLISGEPSNKDLEAAAQILRDRLGADAFADALRSAMPDPPLNDQMRRRLELLQGIPFRSVLTTNFDGLLDGRAPGREQEGRRAVQRVARSEPERGVQVVALGQRVVDLGAEEERAAVVVVTLSSQRLFTTWCPTTMTWRRQRRLTRKFTAIRQIIRQTFVNTCSKQVSKQAQEQAKKFKTSSKAKTRRR